MSKSLKDFKKVNTAPYKCDLNNTNIEQTLYEYNGCYSNGYDIADNVVIKFKVVSYC